MPLWAFSVLSDWMMLGVTLILSFAALWYAAFLAIEQAHHSKQQMEAIEEIRGLVQRLVDKYVETPHKP